MFQIYAKDINKRMEVQQSILKVMTQIKTHIERSPNHRSTLFNDFPHYVMTLPQYDGKYPI